MRKISCVLILFLLIFFTIINPVMAEDFFELVKDGSSEEVQKAVNAGANINARDKYGYTPLMDASYGNENPEVIEVLLESGAGINARDKDEGTHVKYAEEQNKNNTISKEEKDNISSEETIDEENILEKIRVVAKKYDSDLQSISKVINVKKYIKIIDITGYTKTYDSKSFVVDVFINTEKNLYKDVLEMSYEIYSLIYENRKNHNINHVSLIYQNNGGKNTAQVTLGINVIKNIFSKKINSVNEFYEIINSNKNLNAEYLEDICVANEYGYISE